MTGAVSFDSNSLQSFNPATQVGIVTNVIEHTNLPEKDMDLIAIANANKSVIPNIEYPNKRIRLEGAIKGSSQSDLDTRIDTFKGYFRGKDKNLDINYAGTTRRYIATANAISVNRVGGLLYATFEIDFVCTEPFGRETSLTTLFTQTGYTSASLVATPTVAGNAPIQLPVITITINSITGVGDFIQLSNNNNNQEILLYGLGIEDGDVIIVDSINQEVTIDGDPVDYNGSFIELVPGAASIAYADGFDTRNINIKGEYYKRYL